MRTAMSAAAPPPPPLHLHLDRPAATPVFDEFEVAGWVISQQPIASVRLEGPAGVIPLALVERPDVRAAFPGHAHVAGFVGYATVDFTAGGGLAFRVEAGGETHAFAPRLGPPALPPAGPPEDLAVAADLRAQKIARLAPHLACPACHRPLPAGTAVCAGCGQAYLLTPDLLDFRTPEQRAAVPAVDATPASRGGVDEVMFSLITLLKDGLILDCGAGCKSRTYSNVINLEIMPYPSTDVLAFNEGLPFRDGTFDAVFTLATLEHVRHPLQAGREIMRVLKPGGIVYSMVPLLAPFHGFPNHFYNMTIEGHKNVYGPELELLDTVVPLSGRPIFALTWILKSWAAGLPPAHREEFLDLRVRDLVGDPFTYIRQNYVRYLSAEANMEIAAVTCILGRKRS